MNSGYDPASESEFDLALDAEGIRSAASRGSLIIGVVQGLKAIMMFGSQMALTRILRPSDFGLIAMIGPLVTFTLILNSMGLAESIVQSPTVDQNRISSVFWGSLVISTALACALAALSPVFALLYRNEVLIPLLLFTSTTIPLSTLCSIPSALLTRRMEFHRLQRNDLMSTFVGLVATVLFALGGARYWSLPLGSLASTLTMLVGLWRMCGWRPSRPTNWRAATKDLSFGANLTAASLATYVTTTADNIIIGAVNGPVALGFYDRSYRFVVQPISQLLSPIGGIAVPLLSRLSDNAPQYRKSYFLMLRASLIVTLPPSVFCMVFSDRVIPLLLGARWLPAAHTFSWIAFGGAASGIYSSLSWLFVSQGRTRQMRTAFIVAAVLNLLSFGIGSYWGVVGVASGGATVFVFITTPLVAAFATRGGIVSLVDFTRCLTPYTIAVAITLPLLFLLKGHLPASPFLWLPMAGAALLCCLTLPVLLFPGERLEIVRSVSTIARRSTLVINRFRHAH